MSGVARVPEQHRGRHLHIPQPQRFNTMEALTNMVSGAAPPSPPFSAANGHDDATTSAADHIVLDTSNAEAMAHIEVKSRPVITRSRLGCASCRKRKKACDLEKPVCGACSRLKLVRHARMAGRPSSCATSCADAVCSQRSHANGQSSNLPAALLVPRVPVSGLANVRAPPAR
jgi:hypothetical protein